MLAQGRFASQIARQPLFDLALAELRLVFGQLEDSLHLHEPYIELNASLLAAIVGGDASQAVSALDAYLLRSERAVLAALQRERGWFTA